MNLLSSCTHQCAHAQKAFIKLLNVLLLRPSAMVGDGLIWAAPLRGEIANNYGDLTALLEDPALDEDIEWDRSKLDPRWVTEPPRNCWSQ